jgi:hypothetical protein
VENLWVTTGDEQARWTASLGEPRDEVARLAAWMSRLLTAGAEHRVYRVLEAPVAGYAADSGIPFAEMLRRRAERDGALDLGHFARGDPQRPARATARMAWAGASGTPVEGDVEDLGVLLQSLHPQLAAAGTSHMVNCSPLDLDGPLLDLRQPDRTRWWRRRGRLVVDISVRSDIWSPWVSGVLAPPSASGRPSGGHDNRPLAERHTPRLNAFLADVRRATEEAGGEWELDEEAPLAKVRLATADGFDLSAPNPWAG